MLWPRRMREFWSWQPGEDMRRLQQEMNRRFSGLWPTAARRGFPAVNVWAGRDDAIVTAELPGIDPGALDISVVGDTLTIAGERKPDAPEGDVVFQRNERETTTFVRKLLLPFRVEPDAVEATYARGILRINLPRLETDKPKQIAVKASN